MVKNKNFWDKSYYKDCVGLCEAGGALWSMWALVLLCGAVHVGL